MTAADSRQLTGRPLQKVPSIKHEKLLQQKKLCSKNLLRAQSREEFQNVDGNTLRSNSQASQMAIKHEKLLQQKSYCSKNLLRRGAD